MHKFSFNRVIRIREITMEKGKLFISKNGKEFRAEILRESNQRKVPIKKMKFSSDELNGQIVSFEMDKGGDVIRIESESGNVIYQKEVTPTPSQSSSQGLPDSFDLAETRLPSDVRKLSITDIDNFALKFNKAARYDETAEKFKFFHKGTKKEDISYEIRPNFGDINLTNILERQKTHADALCGNNVKILTFSPDWRLIVGIGSESVYETSITLHHVYGIPYIPASAIKGVTRNYVISEDFDSEEEALECQEFCDIFGSKTREGKIIFFDAFPINQITLETDVMNVHYPDYYSGKTSPTDTQNPNPIFFLTVGKETKFCLRFGVKSKEYGYLLNMAETCLTNALQQRGLGAKTAVGYGYMSKNK